MKERQRLGRAHLFSLCNPWSPSFLDVCAVLYYVPSSSRHPNVIPTCYCCDQSVLLCCDVTMNFNHELVSSYNNDNELGKYKLEFFKTHFFIGTQTWILSFVITMRDYFRSWEGIWNFWKRYNNYVFLYFIAFVTFYSKSETFLNRYLLSTIFCFQWDSLCWDVSFAITETVGELQWKILKESKNPFQDATAIKQRLCVLYPPWFDRSVKVDKCVCLMLSFTKEWKWNHPK